MSARDRRNREWLLWYGGGLIAAIAIGGIAASFHAAGRAPLGIVSLGVGVTLAAALYALAAVQRLAGRSSLITGTFLLALVAILAQHAWLYRDFRRQWHEARAKSPEVAMFRPEAPWSPREYFAREMTPRRVALWSLDAALITTAAVGAVVVLQRRRQ